ncbi:AAA family ATPase [Oceanobacillus sp. CAU 1775]
MDSAINLNAKGRINIILQEKAPPNPNSIDKHVNRHFLKIEETFAPFIGMDEIKETVKQVYATYIINEKRSELGFSTNKQVLHMLFKGNPGTGKTSVARQLAKLYVELGILSKGHFTEIERADIVGEYIGSTAQKTRAVIQKAMGGILFIDEAYSLARGGEKDFGKEAIDTLVKHMEDHHNDFILILAGYPYEMEKFLRINPGLKSRFPFILDFSNYKIDELMKITKQMVKDREYYLTKAAEERLKIILLKNINDRNFSNARLVRNIVEKAIRQQAYRLVQNEKFQPEDIINLSAEDFKLND